MPINSIDKEEWKDIPNFEPFQASSLGRVRRSPSSPTGFGRIPGKVMSPSKDGGGYLQVCLSMSRKPRTIKVHRLVAIAFIGSKPDGMTVNHKDGNKENNCASNLEYVSNRENLRHAIRIGIYDPGSNMRGKSVPKKITQAKANEIRQRASLGEKRASLAVEFGIHVMTVGEIVRGEIWNKEVDCGRN